MQPDDQLAEWLIRWEEARTADHPPPELDELPTELRPKAQASLRLLRDFARMAHGLNAIVPASPGDAPPAPPDTPRYRFEEFLARGGMADVWRGRDTRLLRDVALKVLREPIFVARFEEEARLVSQLAHPAIVPVYDLGELSDRRRFFAMKLVHGQTLADLLAARETPADDLPRWVDVFEQVCLAVAFAHARDLIHRDLKPSNVMLSEYGEVLVMDWGIAKALAVPAHAATTASTAIPPSPSVAAIATNLSATETLPGQATGTPAFMSPEQARGEVHRVGKPSDVFGLGGILGVILTGQPPYTKREQPVTGDVTEAFARLDASGADPDLIALAKACLAPEPEARPANAGEVAERVTRHRTAVAARQAEKDRLLWLCHTADDDGEALPAAAEDARARLRDQVALLLRAEVAAQAQRLSSPDSTESTAARQVLELMRVLPALSRVRDPAGLATLPESERLPWQAFWAEVDGLLRGPVQTR